MNYFFPCSWHEFIVRSEGQDGYTLGENYLVVSGTGDIEAIRQVAWSLR